MTEAVLKGLLLGLLLAISVGPVIFSIIKQSINHGFNGGISFAIGVASSDATLILVSNVFTELFTRLLRFEKIIGIGGSMLLMAMGAYFIFFKKVEVNDEGAIVRLPMRHGDYARIYFAGYFMNLLNPGVIAFWFTWATAFVTEPVKNRIALFGTCISVVFLADLLKVLLAGKLRHRLTAATVRYINRITGMVLVVFGVMLLAGLLLLHKP